MQLKMRLLYFIAAKTRFLSHFNISKIGMLLIIDSVRI